MIRAIALSLALLIGIGTIIPLATDYAEAGAKNHRKYAKKKKKVKKYSKQWWRQHQARSNRKKALLVRKRMMRLRQIRLARQNRSTGNGETQVKNDKQAASRQIKEDNTASLLPSGEAAPKSWKKSQSTQSELQFSVNDENGSQLGSASIAVVGPAVGSDENTGKVKTVGGVPTTSLRRSVIDRMIRENGWVVNDYQKEIAGRRVYVVVAQSEGKAGAVQSRVFYFAEADGRIYSIATNAPNASFERIAEESEKVINSLVRRRQNAQQAELK